MKKNIFVIGDLIIDHTVFAHQRTEAVQPTESETVLNVLRRQDTAGGAANSARILAVLNDGLTYLWGVLGDSRWGNYRSILESSELLDDAHSNIELRGVQDETHAPMTTITRIVVVRDDGTSQRTLRFDDAGHVHVTPTKQS